VPPPLQVCGGRPAYLTRHDLHMALANSAALALAGVGPDTPEPEGGTIDRDPATGRPTGLLRWVQRAAESRYWYCRIAIPGEFLTIELVRAVSVG
jgi:predicted amidohydrolase YtcJ